MAQKNKAGNFFSRTINAHRVSKHRKISLIKDYQLGLAYEYKRDLETFIDNETARIEKYYREDIASYKKQIDGISLIDDKRERLIKRYKEKQYWARRKYKTAQKRKVDEAALQALLIAFDQKQKEALSAYEEKLQHEYKHVAIRSREKEVLLTKIKKFDDIKQKRIDAINVKYEKKAARFEKFQKRNTAYIASLDQKHQSLERLISVFNKKRIEEDKEKLIRLNESLLAL